MYRTRMVITPQCVGEMIFCVHEPQYAAQDPWFGYNIPSLLLQC
jgi:hypothetical protein